MTIQKNLEATAKVRVREMVRRCPTNTEIVFFLNNDAPPNIPKKQLNWYHEILKKEWDSYWRDKKLEEQKALEEKRSSSGSGSTPSRSKSASSKKSTPSRRFSRR